MRVPGVKVEKVEIEGKEFIIFLDVEKEFRRHVVMGIGPLNIIEGGEEGITGRLAEKIAERYGATLTIANFGGWSGGDPPDDRWVFTIPMKKEGLGTYINELKTKEIEEEIKEAKKKLITVVRELYQAIDKAVEFLMHLLPKKRGLEAHIEPSRQHPGVRIEPGH